MVNQTYEVQNINIEQEQGTNLKQQIRNISKLITIEPIVALYKMSNGIREAALDNLVLEKACIASAGFNTTVCNSVIKGTYREQNFTAQNDVVQLYSNSMYAWTSSVNSLLCIVMSLFLSAYSDKHKIRIPFILAGIVGELIANGGSEISAIFMYQLSLSVYGFFGNVVSSLFGGWTMMYSAFYAYAADISTPETYTLKLSLIYGISHISLPIGQLLGGVIFKNTGYTMSLSLSSILLIIAFLYAVFRLKESRIENTNEEFNGKWLIVDFCDYHYVIAPFQLLIKLKGYKRCSFLCVIVILWIFYTVELGELNVLFLFAQNAFQWTAVTKSNFIAATSAMQTLGITIGLYIVKKVFKLSRLTMVFLALFDSLLTRIIFLTFKSSVGLYIGELFGVIRRLVCIALRAESLTYVSDGDNGKVQSIITCLESLAVMSGGLIYTKGVYAYTESTYPYAIFIVGIVLILIAIGLAIITYFNNKKITEEEIST